MGPLVKEGKRNRCLFLTLKGSLGGWIIRSIMKILRLRPEGVTENIGN